MGGREHELFVMFNRFDSLWMNMLQLFAPAGDQKATTVTGGGINPPEADGSHTWIIKPIKIKIGDEDKYFGDIYIGDYHCKQFLGTNYKMVDHIKGLRNQKVRALMLELSKDADPNEENPKTADSLILPKKELYDQLPKTTQIFTNTHKY